MVKLLINTKVDKMTFCNLNTTMRKVFKYNVDDQSCLTKGQVKTESSSSTMLAHNSKISPQDLP